jgi:Methyltransferase domain
MAFRSYHGRIDGWMTEWELYLLYSHSTFLYNCGDRLLEIGSWQGLSTSALMQVGCPLDCVDTFEGSPDTGGPFQELIMRTLDRPVREVFDENVDMVHWESPGSVLPTVHQMKSEEFLEKAVANETKYRLIFVDGDHNYETARNDLEQCRKLLHPGGVLMFDDCAWADVNRAATDVFPSWRALDGKIGVFAEQNIYGTTGSR